MLHAKLTEVLSSNRTFMELKLLGIAAFVAVMFGSNRTFMELKYYRITEQRNFNAGSNRTFMELKYQYGCIQQMPRRF